MWWARCTCADRRKLTRAQPTRVPTHTGANVYTGRPEVGRHADVSSRTSCRVRGSTWRASARTYKVPSVCVLTPVPDSMVLITDKFWGPTGAESVIGGVHLWLAEAIGALQDSSDTLTAKVRAGACGGQGGLPRIPPCTLPGPLRSPPGHPGLREPQGEPPGP